MIRFGIIGAGRLGNVHAQSIDVLENATLTAVYDIAEAPAKAMQEKYGAAICNSADELAQHPEVDAIIISSPTYCHIEGIRAGKKAGKPFFCEKPLVRFKEDGLEAAALIAENNKPFAIGFVRRHMLKTQKVKEILDSGVLGKIRYANIDLPFGSYARQYGDWFTDFKKSGGVIYDMLAHHVDLANWFFGKAKRVYAQSMMLDPEQELPADYVSSTVTYENGVILNLMCSWWRTGRSGECMEICGEKGSLSMTGAADLTLHLLGSGKEIVKIDEKAAAVGVNNASTGNGFVNELSNFIAMVEGKEFAFMPGVEDGLRSLAVADAMERSAKTHQIVEL